MTTTTQLINTSGTLIAPQLDYILLDGSSSMRNKWWDSLASIDAYMDTLKAANLNAQVILATFCSHDISCVQRDQRLSEWVPLSQQPIGSHWGGTPLYDAIIIMGARLRELNPAKAHIVIVTDGEEMGSKLPIEQAQAVLRWLKAKGYQVTFLGADFNNAGQVAGLMGTQTAGVGVAQARLTDAAKELGRKTVRHSHTGEDISWSDDERKDFGGYLT